MTLHVDIASTPEQLKQIYRLRYDVYVAEMHKRPDGANHEARTLSDEFDALATNLMAREDGALVGAARFVPVDAVGADHFWRKLYDTDLFPVPDSKKIVATKLVSKRELRGASVATSVISRMYELARSRAVELTFLHCSPSLVPLYERIGCRRYKRSVMDPEVGLRIPMVMLLGDVAYLQSIRSPLAPLAARFGSTLELARWFDEYLAATRPEWDSPEDAAQDAESSPAEMRGPVFDGLNQAQRARIVAAMVKIRLGPGEYLLRAGDAGSEMFTVLRGSLEVRRSPPSGGPKRPVARVEEGQIFGEGAFLAQNGQRSADVVALEPTTVGSFSNQALEKLRASDPDAAFQLVRNIAQIVCTRLYTER